MPIQHYRQIAIQCFMFADLSGWICLIWTNVSDLHWKLNNRISLDTSIFDKKRRVRGLLENIYVMCKAGFSSPLGQMLLFDLNLDGTWDRKVGRRRRRKDTNLLSGWQLKLSLDNNENFLMNSLKEKLPARVITWLCD